MSVLIPTIRSVVREELAACQPLALGVVTQVFSNEGGSGDSNLEVNLRLRGSALELQRVPLTVPRRGLSMAPREGDLAVVSFVGGDIHGAIVLGLLYDEQTAPPDAGPEEIVYEVPDDQSGDTRRLELKLPNGNKLTLLDGKLSIEMGSTTVTVEADGAISLEAGGDLTLKSGGKITLEATTDLTLKGVNVSCEAQAAAKLKGASVGIAGMTNFSAS
jgi:phage baseplate assembly protein gpV